MKVVIDTNVFVSAAIMPSGTPARIVAAWEEGRFEVVTSAVLTAELARTMALPRIAARMPPGPLIVVRILRAIEQRAVLVAPARTVQVCRDEDDNRDFEAAMEAEVDYVVSGDRDVQAVGSFESIRVVSPSAFLTLLEDK